MLQQPFLVPTAAKQKTQVIDKKIELSLFGSSVFVFVFLSFEDDLRNKFLPKKLNTEEKLIIT